METIGAILERVRSTFKSSTTAQPPPPAHEPCPDCGGAQYLRLDRQVGEEGFGEIVVCDACTPSPESFFEGLDVDNHNRKAMEAAVTMALRPEGWLILVGKRGTGKTTILKALKSAWARAERNPVTAVELLDGWRASFKDGDFDSLFHAICRAPLASFDDLAAPKATDWAVERVTALLDYRYVNKLPTAITTDLDEVQMAEAFGPRLADRVFDQRTGLCKVITLGGPSRRTGREW